MFTERISPNNTPKTSNLIKDKKPSITNPIANEECEIKPSRESPAKFVDFSNLSKISATRDETTKIVNETFIFRDIYSKTPSNAE